MFINYRFVSLTNSSTCTFKYQVVDSNFTETDNVTLIGPGVGGAVEMTTSVIHAYEKQKASEMDLVKNLILALRWHSDKHNYPFEEGLEKIKELCPPYEKYEVMLSNCLKN